MFAYEAKIPPPHLSGVKGIEIEIVHLYRRLLILDDGDRRQSKWMNDSLLRLIFDTLLLPLVMLKVAIQVPLKPLISSQLLLVV
jgi:hypothetical protein